MKKEQYLGDAGKMPNDQFKWLLVESWTFLSFRFSRSLAQMSIIKLKTHKHTQTYLFSSVELLYWLIFPLISFQLRPSSYVTTNFTFSPQFNLTSSLILSVTISLQSVMISRLFWEHRLWLMNALQQPVPSLFQRATFSDQMELFVNASASSSHKSSSRCKMLSNCIYILPYKDKTPVQIICPLNKLWVKANCLFLSFFFNF